MVISKDKKFLFIRIQKTASSSITDYLKTIYPDCKETFTHSLAKEEKKKITNWNDYFKFSFVRNPYERLVSWYNMIYFNHNHESETNELWKYAMDNSTNFTEFIKNCTEPIWQEGDGYRCFSWNQLDYISDDIGIIMDYIGRYENLNADFEKICKKINIPTIVLPKVNVGKKVNYREYYTEETKEIITERFNRDIEYFNYKF